MVTRFGHVMWLAAVCALSVWGGAQFLAALPAAPQGTQLAAMPPAQGVDKKTHHLILT